MPVAGLVCLHQLMNFYYALLGLSITGHCSCILVIGWNVVSMVTLELLANALGSNGTKQIRPLSILFHTLGHIYVF